MDNKTDPQAASVDPVVIRRENEARQKQIAADPIRMADADYVLRWVYQAGIEKIPPNIYDLAARALGFPSLAHGHADETICDEVTMCKWGGSA